MAKKLLIILFTLLLTTPVYASLIGDINTSLVVTSTRIEFIDSEGVEQSAAFRYSEDIKVVIVVVLFNPYVQRWKYKSIRYLKDGKLHYYAWNTELSEYTLTEAPIGIRDFWIKQLKKYVDGV